MSDEDNRNTVQVEDENLRAGFTVLPNLVFRWRFTDKNGEVRRLSPGAKVTYVALLSYAWQEGSCFPGQERLADDVGCSLRSVHTYLDELVTAKLVVVKQRGLNRTNLYILPKFT